MSKEDNQKVQQAQGKVSALARWATAFNDRDHQKAGTALSSIASKLASKWVSFSDYITALNFGLGLVTIKRKSSVSGEIKAAEQYAQDIATLTRYYLIHISDSKVVERLRCLEDLLAEK